MTTETQALADHFERVPRDDGDPYYRLKDDAPEWLKDAVYDADENVDRDWHYDKMHSIALGIDEAVEYDGLDDDSPNEIADALTDIYYYDLMRWLQGGWDTIDDTYAEMGWPDEGFSRLVMWAQCSMLERMARILCDAYTENKDEELDDEGR